ncbi:MAG: hypothetical protein AAF515_14470 [Pseudomonadota bacterium]
MNLKKLREAEGLFLLQYPDGFADEAMAGVRKRHGSVDKLTEFARVELAKKKFDTPGNALDAITKIVSRSSMVSMFEKPKFRDYVNGMTRDDREYLAGAYRNMLHGKRAQGFADVVDVLGEAKLAKWSLLTICLFHYRPTKDVFVKPTTTKNVIRVFELEGLEYKPRPSWAFYSAYRRAIDEMKSAVNPSLHPSNAAFTGFLMMSTGSAP